MNETVGPGETVLMVQIPNDLLERMKKVSKVLLDLEEEWQGRHTFYLLLELGLENFEETRRELWGDSVISSDTRQYNRAEIFPGSKMLEAYGYVFVAEEEGETEDGTVDTSGSQPKGRWRRRP